MKIIMLFILMSFDLFSYHQSFEFKKNKDDHYLISYLENEKFILDHIVVPQKKLQELISRNFFNSKKELESFRAKKFSHHLRRKSRFSKNKYLTSETPEVIWKVKNKWNIEWEKKFSKWVQKEFDEDFFVKYQISTDCADVAFALRWIFSRMNFLPAANTLAGSHIIFSQDSFKSDWKNLERNEVWHKDKVFLSALNYLMEHAYTATLNIDGYPIELNKESFLVGTIHLDGGHTMIISEINYDGTSTPIRKLSSTVPAQIRKLYNEVMIDQTMTDKESGGLFRMRWPVKKENRWSLISKEEMPLYSLEQYSQSFLANKNNFTMALIERLGIDFNPKVIIASSFDALVDSLEKRISIVQDGYHFCLINNCEEGSFNYEEHSTPSRDKRINEAFKTLENLAIQLSDFDSTLVEHFNNLLKRTNLKVNGQLLVLKELKQFFYHGILSYHPDDTIEERWALNQHSIENALSKKFSRLKTKRKNKISEALICKNQDCSRGTDLYNKLNTFKVDDIFKRKIYLASKFVESRFKITPVLHNLKDEINKIPFYKSEPKNEFRWAENINTDEYVYDIFNSRSIMELSDDIVLSNYTLINTHTKERKKIIKAGQFYYNEKNKSLLAVKNSNLYFLDLHGNVINKEIFDYKIHRLQWIGDSHFTIQGENISGVSKKNYIYKLSNFKIKKVLEIPFNNFNYLEDGVILERVESNNSLYYHIGSLLYYQKDTELVKRVLPAGSNIYDFKDEKAVYSYQNYLYIEKNQEKECKIKIKNKFLIRNLFFDNTLLQLGPNGSMSNYYYAIKDCKMSEKLLSSDEYFASTEIWGTKLIRTFSENFDIYSYEENKLIKIQGPPGYRFSTLDFENYYFIKYDENSISDYIAINKKTNNITRLNKFQILDFCKQELPYIGTCDSKANAYVSHFYQQGSPSKIYKSIYINNFHFFDILKEYSQENGTYLSENYQLKSFDRYEFAPGIQFFIKKKL